MDSHTRSISVLILILILMATRAHTQGNKEEQNDMMPSRMDRGDLILQHAMAYEFLGTPTQARQILWLHLPLDITALLDAPEGLITIAGELQNTCDAALIATTNKLYGNPTETQQDEPLKAPETIEDEEFKWLWQYDPVSLPEVKAACENNNMTMPTPARYDRKYKKRLNKFLDENHIKEILIDSYYSAKDHMNRLPPHGHKPSHAFPGSRHIYPERFSPKDHEFVKAQSYLENYDDDNDVTYAYRPNGKITAYFAPANAHQTYEKLMGEGMTRREIDRGDHLAKGNVICEKSKDTRQREQPREREATKMTKPETRGYSESVQLCYDTVDQIEYRGVKEYLQLGQVFARYNLVNNARILPTSKKEQDPRRQRSKETPLNDQPKEIKQKKKRVKRGRKRNKRFIPSIALRGALTLGKMIAKRAFATQMKPFLAHSGIRNIAPGKRRAASLLKSVIPFAADNPIPILMGVSGIGYSVWRNYKTNKRFDEQLKIIKENQHRIEKHATELSTVKLEVVQNYETLNQIKVDMFKTQQELRDMYNIINIVASTQLLQKTMIKVIQETNIMAEETQMQYNNLVEILLSISSDTIPGVFLSEIKAKANVLGLTGDQMLPNPERAVSISPLIENGKLNIYANFITGERQWEMYKIIPIPRFANGQSFTTEIEFNYALVGKAQGQYMPLSDDEARSCKMGACEPTGTIKRINDDNCTIKMIGLSKPSENCPVKTTTETPFFKSTINGLLYSVPRDTIGRLNCKDKPEMSKVGIDQVVKLQGMGIYDIPTGCDFRINKPEVVVLGPPQTISEVPTKNGAIKLQHSSKAFENQTFSTQRQEQRAIRSEQTHLKNQIKVTKTKMGKYTLFMVIIIATVTALLLTASGKLVWLTIIHKKVKRTYHKSKEAVQRGNAALATGFSSIVKHADAVNAVLLNRRQLNKYLKGDRDTIPLKRHISLINLENGEKENRLLGQRTQEDEEEDGRVNMAKYPYLPPLQEQQKGWEQQQQQQ